MYKQSLMNILKQMFYCLIIQMLGWHSVSANEPHQKGHLIVSADWLMTQQKSSNPHLKVIDVRTEREFLKGHIVNAINIPAEKSFEGSRIISFNNMRELLSASGLRNEDTIVIYDDGYIKNAAHVFWALETYGHKNVRILDGGIAYWEKNGGELTDKVTKFPVSKYTPSISAHHLATKLSTRIAIDNPNVLIIDSRNKSEYLGEFSKANRAGHIPNAVNKHAADNLNYSSGIPEIKTISELADMYGNINKSNKVLTYCNRGKDSAMSYVILRNLGYDVSVYDGGWLEWGNDSQLPIAK